MEAKQLRNAALLFVRMGRSGPDISLTFGKPWVAYEGGPVPYAKDAGVYVFCSMDPSIQVCPMIHSHSEVWYIGKASKLRDRVRGHLKKAEIRRSGAFFYPTHEWKNRKNISADTKKALRRGEMIVYTIRVDGEGEMPGFPTVLEKFLLACFYREHGHIPVLNSALRSIGRRS